MKLPSKFKNLGLNLIFCFLIILPVEAAITPDAGIQKDLYNVFDMTFESPAYPYLAAMIEASERYGFPLPLVLAVARGESFFDANAKSAKGAIGIMQIMPATAGDYDVEATDLYDPSINIDVGVHLLSDLYQKLGDPYLALAAYYCGCGGVDKKSVSLRTDCDEYVKYIHTHLKTILAASKNKKSSEPDSLQKTVITYFDNLLDAKDFLAFISIKVLEFKFEIFRTQVRLQDHFRYQYQIVAVHGGRADKTFICRQIEDKTGFDFSRN